MDQPILIVDDDFDIREALVDAFEDNGFAVLTAANGLEALSLLRDGKESPSVILLDLMMPVMDGYAFLDEQQKDPALATIPVAIITAGHGVDRSRLGDSPRIVRKPIRFSELLSTVRLLLSDKGVAA